MDHNHRNDGYGTEHLYMAIVQILSTDSVKPSVVIMYRIRKNGLFFQDDLLNYKLRIAFRR